MRYKFVVPMLAIAGTIVATDFASAQVKPENAPMIETRRETFFKRPYRESTILRPQTATGDSHDTPNENQNYYTHLATEVDPGHDPG